MQQLTGVDQLFVGLASPTTNTVVGALVTFEKPEDGQPLPDEAFMRKRFEDRLDYLVPMRQIMIETPLMLDYDYLGEVDRVDIAAHLTTVQLPGQGDYDDLCGEIARIMGTSLVPDRPRWDYTIFEGLEGGGIAHLLRVDHAAVDGAMFTYLFNALADEPGQLREEDTKIPFPEPLGGKPEMFLRGLFGAATKPVKAVTLQAAFAKWLVDRFPEDRLTTIPALVAKLIPGDVGKPLVDLINRRQRAAGQPEIASLMPTLFPPRTPFNRHVSSRRTYAFTELPLAEGKAVGKTFGMTLNHVFVSLCAGAVRRLMEANGYPVDKPLVVCVPVSLRKGDEKDPWANHINMMFLPFPTDLSDPVDRLHACAAELKKAKESFDALPQHLVRQASSLIPGEMMILGTNLLVRLPGDLSRTWFNVTLSNVRGPAQLNRMNGLAVRGYFPASFLTVGGNLNVSLWSYEGRMCIGVAAAREQIGDLTPFVGYLHDALEELREAADRTGAGKDGPILSAVEAVS